ncbi:Hsp70 family protein [Luteibacter aegosomatis]|uniref:Hsp70 family protein n=1 Tax=Luteibacter aegosomatis TaxID=2911537 RepID=UPI001FF7E591|nr:Hsp70 family protein [Luteibacter aegosomatis]UPG85420.1 Hsp70 family protein [Luteibacter aegosomatis]
MNIGIDFGTSYSAAATFVDGVLTPIRFGEAKQFRSAVFFPEVVPDPAEVRRRAERAAATVESFSEALFGDEAVEAYLEYGDGNLIESPKSMFGYRMDPQVRKVIVHIATYILEHIRLAASDQLGAAVRTAVIGRPVHFRSSMGEKGSQQAVEIIREAAAVAGFESVSFLEEPAAAAMHYHKQLKTRQTALIVDIGGGTTDVAFAELGGDEMPRILRTWGLAKGGTDLDVNLSMQSFMPLMGNNATRVPVHHFVEAASVQNLPKQREFRKQDYRFVDEPWRSRLRALQQPGATTRLNQTAERSKIDLTSRDATDADLGFLESGLGARVTHSDLDQAAEPFIERMRRLLDEVRGEWPGVPASVFLTGGTSRSPIVKAAVRASFAEIPMVEGDPSLGVVSGLAVAAVEATG